MVAKVSLNHGGIAAIAKSSEVRRAVDAVADRVADHVRSMGIQVEGVPGDVSLPIEVRSQTSDRARAQVVIAHPSGAAVQAKHGALTKAAAQVGLDVDSR